jgi:hypothetical protein
VSPLAEGLTSGWSHAQRPAGQGLRAHAERVEKPNLAAAANHRRPLLGKAEGAWLAREPLAFQRLWRRERDSNPRGLGGPCGFRVRGLTCCGVS